MLTPTLNGDTKREAYAIYNPTCSVLQTLDGRRLDFNGSSLETMVDYCKKNRIQLRKILSAFPPSKRHAQK
jgi:hypothetical protein